jgi:hypothetical protein
MPETVVSPAYAEKAAAQAALYRREKEVVYACLFLCGRHEGKPCRAPLLLYQGAFGQANPASFQIKTHRWRINPRALEMLQTDADTLTGIVRGGVLDEATLGAIRQWAENLGVETGALWQWPELAKKTALDEAATRPGLSLLPAAAIGIVPRSVSLRGVLDELDALAKSGPSTWSEPLRILLGNAETPPGAELDDETDAAVPAVLSRSQEQIVASARVHPLTLCHGPPGTGKSFTIAAVALDHVARGETVLVASRMDHAVNVVQEKIDAMIGGGEVTVRAGRKDYLSELKHFIEACLSGQATVDAPNARRMNDLKGQMKETRNALREAEDALKTEWENALSRGKLLASPPRHWWDSLRRAWVKRRVRNRPLLMEWSEEIEDLYRRRELELASFLRLNRKRQLDFALQNDAVRKDFQLMLKALRKYRGSEQEEIFHKMDVRSVLKALPVWLVNLKDVHRVLPLQNALFDVAIIDEASQCDLASVLPVIQRAKRLVVAGDTRQLRHISFLPRMRQESLARELGVNAGERETFDYRNVSLMDHVSSSVSSQSQIGFLNEHFRSSPRIIAFSNRRFYQNSLIIMRERPWEPADHALSGHRCQGKRDPSGVNQGEIDALLADLEELVEQSAALPAARRPTIGVLSPFRDQVEAILAALGERLPKKTMRRLLDEHDLRVGTAYAFQGEERDTMFLSFCIDADTNPATLRFLERADVFNVSITRARSRQIVYHSLDAEDLPPSSLLREYLANLDATSRTSPEASASAEPDRFAREVAGALREVGVEVILSRRVAGIGIDLLVIDGPRVLGIDLIGYPGETFEAVDLHRIKILRRAGFRLLPLGYAEWSVRKEATIKTNI